MSTELTLIKRDTVDVVAEKVRSFQENGELHFPVNYSPENAMKAAWLAIQEVKDKSNKPALEVCTRDSVANALLNMVVQGLNPVKKQCYFIVYGNQLVLQRSYFGTMHIAKTVNPNIEDIVGEVVYEGQKFQYKKERGRIIVTEHLMQLGDDSKPIVAAYCQVLYKDGSENTTVMSFEEIKAAWTKSPTHPLDADGNVKSASTHGQFTAEMAKKTVINRACKPIINSSGDDTLLIRAFRHTEADIAEAEAKEEISAKANSQFINVDITTGEVTNPDAVDVGVTPPEFNGFTVDSGVDDLP